jgi:MinD-like ATPase involved in chromosome partitioning or flagellar assembly
MVSLVSFSDLMALVLSGVTVHNALRFLATKLTAVATAVETGDVKTLVHDAKGVADWVQTHDPALAKAVESEYDKLKSAAEADVAAARHAAAEEIRKLATAVEKAAVAAPEAPQPASPETPPAV